jgi:AAA15 family ATPase/GTPase
LEKSAGYAIFANNMKIKTFHIQNFKSVKDTKIMLDSSVSVLTGVNNCGKTTIIEALALWVECFQKLVHQAKRKVAGKYNAGDNVLASSNKYFDFADINSVRSPNFEDIFYNRDVRTPIRLSALLDNGSQQLRLPFVIANSTKSRYVISLDNEGDFNYALFNTFFTKWPLPVKSYFSAPLANIVQQETFVTDPVLQDGLRQRRSFEIIRNRLYKIYHTDYFHQFQQDLSYVLYGPTLNAKLKLYSRSDRNQDTRVVITYTIGGEQIEKDVALLGSGTLQAIEILLNIYNEVNGACDLNLILLDEPDSHIHRDIQKRLFGILNRERINSQIIITTHNESMIRTAPLSNLFHVDLNQKVLQNIGKNELYKIEKPHFKGLYPAIETPIIRSINGEATGLDLISAIEAEKIIFVEGDDDARLLYNLFHKRPSNRNRKIMFWVLGGISRMLTKLEGYHEVFSTIRNGRTLWDKSVIVFDHDWMTDEHVALTQEKLQSKFNISSYVAMLYTQESVLLTDLKKLALLLAKRYDLTENQLQPLEDALANQCSQRLANLQTKQLCNPEIERQRVKQYIGQYITPLNTLFGCNIKDNTLSVAQVLSAYYNTQPIHKLCTKFDVEEIINAAAIEAGLTFHFDVETDFYSLVTLADSSCMFDQWNKLTDFLSL